MAPALAILAICAVVPNSAKATIISGNATLGIGNGSVSVSGNGITTGCIDWYNISAPSCPQPAGTTGTFSVQAAGSTGIFNGSQTGTIQDLNFLTTFPVVDFMVVSNGAMFDLTHLLSNAGGNIGDIPDGRDR